MQSAVTVNARESMLTAAVIVSTYNQPRHLARCLAALDQQTVHPLEVIVADDGSGAETRAVIEQSMQSSPHQLKHVWHEDRGFRKTEILNKAILATAQDYLVFIDGDCLAQSDFVHEHLKAAERGHYLNGSLIRLGRQLSAGIGEGDITRGKAFRTGWLIRRGRGFNRRYLRLALGYRLRCRLNDASRTRLYWLGSNSSCFRGDAVAVNGFDNRFSYGFEDGDFGRRLEMHGVTPKTVRWTANVLHLWHAKPWSGPEVIERNRKLMEENVALNRVRAISGLDEVRERAR